MNKVKNDICIENRRARHDYFVEDTLECGIELLGNEVKSLRSGMASIKEAWVSVDNGELFIKQMHITKWSTSNNFDVEENRNRKLLAHKSEIVKLGKAAEQQGYTLVPLKVYKDNHSRFKVLVGVCKGKHNYDKRATEKERQIKRDIERYTK